MRFLLGTRPRAPKRAWPHRTASRLVLPTGKELASRRGDYWLKSVAFSPDGRWLAYADGQENVRLLDLGGRRPDSAGNPRSP
jgi:hypothetical protein